MQASPDLGNVDIQANGKNLVSNLGWRGVFPMFTTNYVNVPMGSLQFQEFATGTTSPALVNTQFSVSANKYYTVLTAGEQSTGSLATIALADDHVPPASGELRIRLVNAASTLRAVDIYLTSPTDPLPATPTLPAFAYKSVSGYMSFPGTGVNICANPMTGGSLGSIPPGTASCSLAIRYQLLSPPPNSATLLLLDPYIPPNPPPGSFTAPVVFAALPY